MKHYSLVIILISAIFSQSSLSEQKVLNSTNLVEKRSSYFDLTESEKKRYEEISAFNQNWLSYQQQQRNLALTGFGLDTFKFTVDITDAGLRSAVMGNALGAEFVRKLLIEDTPEYINNVRNNMSEYHAANAEISRISESDIVLNTALVSLSYFDDNELIKQFNMESYGVEENENNVRWLHVKLMKDSLQGLISNPDYSSSKYSKIKNRLSGSIDKQLEILSRSMGTEITKDQVMSESPPLVIANGFKIIEKVKPPTLKKDDLEKIQSKNQKTLSSVKNGISSKNPQEKIKIEDQENKQLLEDLGKVSGYVHGTASLISTASEVGLVSEKAKKPAQMAMTVASIGIGISSGNYFMAAQGAISMMGSMFGSKKPKAPDPTLILLSEILKDLDEIKVKLDELSTQISNIEQSLGGKVYTVFKEAQHAKWIAVDNIVRTNFVKCYAKTEILINEEIDTLTRLRNNGTSAIDTLPDCFENMRSSIDPVDVGASLPQFLRRSYYEPIPSPGSKLPLWSFSEVDFQVATKVIADLQSSAVELGINTESPYKYSIYPEFDVSNYYQDVKDNDSNQFAIYSKIIDSSISWETDWHKMGLYESGVLIRLINLSSIISEVSGVLSFEQPWYRPWSSDGLSKTSQRQLIKTLEYLEAYSYLATAQRANIDGLGILHTLHQILNTEEPLDPAKKSAWLKAQSRSFQLIGDFPIIAFNYTQYAIHAKAKEMESSHDFIVNWLYDKRSDVVWKSTLGHSFNLTKSMPSPNDIQWDVAIPCLSRSAKSSNNGLTRVVRSNNGVISDIPVTQSKCRNVLPSRSELSSGSLKASSLTVRLVKNAYLATENLTRYKSRTDI